MHSDGMDTDKMKCLASLTSLGLHSSFFPSCQQPRLNLSSVLQLYLSLCLLVFSSHQQEHLLLFSFPPWCGAHFPVYSCHNLPLPLEINSQPDPTTIKCELFRFTASRTDKLLKHGSRTAAWMYLGLEISIKLSKVIKGSTDLLFLFFRKSCCSQRGIWQH